MDALKPVSLENIRAARERIAGAAIRTPLVRLNVDDLPANIFLKLENLQPIGSFKLRGALNRMRAMPRDSLAEGVYTASAGNMAQGVAWAARALGVPASVIVPESAPQAKRDAIQRLGARIISVPYDEWWAAMRDGGQPGMRGVFVHPFADRDVMAGNGTALQDDRAGRVAADQGAPRELHAREAIVEFGRSLFLRGYSCGTSGNLSVRLPGNAGFLMSVAGAIILLALYRVVFVRSTV